MSGGSWNYLYSKDIDDLMQYSNIELLEEMADYLNQNGYEDVAKDTRRLAEYIKSASIRIETLFEALSPVFKAVEWFDSGDWGEETLNNEILKYRNARLDNYNKGVDDTIKFIKEKYAFTILEEEEIDEIAERLKGAKQNEDFKQKEIQQAH